MIVFVPLGGGDVVKSCIQLIEVRAERYREDLDEEATHLLDLTLRRLSL